LTAASKIAETQDFDYLVLIGRFNFFHLGHLMLLTRALARAKRVIVVLGSAFRPRSPKHPLLWKERKVTMERALEPTDAERLHFLPVRDYHDDDKWLADVISGVSKIVPTGSRVGIIGHSKDETSYYLKCFPQWEQVEISNYAGLNATDLRNVYYSDKPWAGKRDYLESKVPGNVLDLLDVFRDTPEYRGLCEWDASNKTERAKYAHLKHGYIYQTADAVVRCNDHVLLVRRAENPGAGLWALPGGHVETFEKILAAALRELSEETGLPFSAAFLKSHLADQDLFDATDRSEKGRVITHAFFFDLHEGACPDVTPSSESYEAKWVHVSELAGYEGLMFEDHFSILCRFLPFILMRGYA